MSFDLHIAPARGFLEWTLKEWDDYFISRPPSDSFRLGRSLYVGLVLEAITHNLEGGRQGSKYPLLMRMDHDENVGWYCDDIGALIEELRDIRSRLATLPVDRVTLNYDDEAQVQKRISDFREIYPQRALNNLYDLNFYFIDGFESLARKALELGRGLVVFY